MMILNNLGIVHLFDAIIDGNKVNRTKPDPEVFTKAVHALGLSTSVYYDNQVFLAGKVGI